MCVASRTRSASMAKSLNASKEENLAHVVIWTTNVITAIRDLLVRAGSASLMLRTQFGKKLSRSVKMSSAKSTATTRFLKDTVRFLVTSVQVACSSLLKSTTARVSCRIFSLGLASSCLWFSSV